MKTTILDSKLVQQLIAMRERVLHYILLDLLKAYNALDRDPYLDILSGYEVGPRTLRILRTYWVQIQMAENVGGYYEPAFQRQRRVTQGEPLLPTILHVVIGAVI